MTLEASPQGPRYRLHAAKRELLESARRLLAALAQSLPESSDECDFAHNSAVAIGELLDCFAAPSLPSDRAEKQLPVGDRG